MAILLVKVNTNNVPDSPGRWYASQIVAAVDDDFVGGSAETLEAGNFYRVKVTDKTVEQVQDYLQGWTHNPTIQQISANGNNRLVEVTSDMVSVSGKNAFTRDGVQGLIDGINSDYPSANVAYDSHTNNSFRLTLTAPASALGEFTERVNEMTRDMQYARRRWGITPAGMNYLANNGGYVERPAAQIANYLRDGLLD